MLGKTLCAVGMEIDWIICSDFERGLLSAHFHFWDTGDPALGHNGGERAKISSRNKQYNELFSTPVDLKLAKHKI